MIIAGLIIGAGQMAAVDAYSAGELQRDVALGAKAIHKGLEDGILHLRSTQVALEAAPDDPQQLSKTLQTMQQLRGDFARFSIIDWQGRVYAAADPTTIGKTWQANAAALPILRP